MASTLPIAAKEMPGRGATGDLASLTPAQIHNLLFEDETLTPATPVATDLFLFQDLDDSRKLKTAPGSDVVGLFTFTQMAALFAAPSSDLIFNEASGDFDVRFEGLSNTHLLFLDGGNNRVGISNASLAPTDGLVHISAGTAGTVAAISTTQLVVEADTDVGISLFCPTANDGAIVFGSPAANIAGSIVYKHTEAEFVFSANTVEVLTIGGDNVFNETGVDINWRMETTGNASKFFLDGGADLVQVAMGTAPTALANVGGRIHSGTTVGATTAVTTEETLQTYTLPADALSVDGKGIKLSFSGITADTTSTKRLRVYFGSEVIVDSGAYSPVDNGDGTFNYVYSFEIIIIRNGSSSQISYSPSVVALNQSFSSIIAGLTQDETGSIEVKVTGQNGTANASDIVIFSFLVEGIE